MVSLTELVYSKISPEQLFSFRVGFYCTVNFLSQDETPNVTCCVPQENVLTCVTLD